MAWPAPMPGSSTEARGSAAKKRTAPTIYAAGGQASQASQSPPAGTIEPATATTAAVKATSTKAGTANRLATGATSETRWKFTAVIGRVKAMAASVTANSSIAA